MGEGFVSGAVYYGVQQVALFKFVSLLVACRSWIIPRLNAVRTDSKDVSTASVVLHEDATGFMKFPTLRYRRYFYLIWEVWL